MMQHYPGVTSIMTDTTKPTKMIERREQNLIQRNWRALGAFVYYAICLFDFILAPVFTWWFSYLTKTPIIPWVSLTLGSGGMLHLAFGALLTATSWAKTKERITPTQHTKETS